MKWLWLLYLISFFGQLKAQQWLHTIGLNLVGPSELFDVHAIIKLKPQKHFLLLGATWKPTSQKFAQIEDINYLVFPVQYQYHFYIFRNLQLDANAGFQFQYNISRYIPNQLKITPVIGLSYTKNFIKNCYYVRGGVNFFIPQYIYADKYETFTYTATNGLLWPQIGVGKYLH
ncbi:MAG: hypothetical protein MUC81_02180 [Bacteroidia bacterium]|jgi:hypothetical protein|nr:hypothetical protein [Bacteroidia bacterium]